MKNMRENKTQIALFIGFVMLTVCAASLAASPVQTWNHRFNPALLGTSSRSLFDTGLSASPGFHNSYFTTGKLSNPIWVIDFNDISESIGDGGYKIGANLRAEIHSTVHLLGAGAGVYTDFDTLFQMSIPKGIFDTIATGNEMDTLYEDSGAAMLRSFVEYGGYAGFRRAPYTFGVKIGKYVPLAYTRDGKGVYTFIANEADGSMTATASVNAELYSVFDLEYMDEYEGDDIMTALTGPGAGIKMDFGVVYNPSRKKPLWGASISNIPLAAAEAQYAWQFTLSAEAHAENILDNVVNEEEFFDFSEEEPEFEAITGDRKIYMPFRIGGFYRVSRLPFVDFIPHAELVFGDPFRVNGGITAEGTVFPLSLLSFGLAYQDIVWQSSMSLRLNLRVIEISTQISMNSPELMGMFSSRGLAVNIAAAVGF